MIDGIVPVVYNVKSCDSTLPMGMKKIINVDIPNRNKNQRTNDPVNAHLISGPPRISTKCTRPEKNKVKK